MQSSRALERTNVLPRDRLIVALDFPKLDDARRMVDQLGDSVSFYKIGLELVMQGGLSYVRELSRQNKRVFLDMKVLDIGHTVERAVASAAETGATFLTVHGIDTKTIKAAVAGREGSNLKVLAVTVLTNLNAADLAEQGILKSPSDMVVHRARIAMEAGCDGVIASGQEASMVRRATGDDFLIVTPGIRMPDDDAGDQSRVTTPATAIIDGANYLVVGRPITQADDPAAAVQAFAAAIASAA